MADDYDPAQVVMRRQKKNVGRYKLDCGLGTNEDDVEGKKKVKWSDSTELREKMKEYRRSQLSVCLDYTHIAVEEEREREGVKRWREIKDKLQSPDEVDDDVIATIRNDLVSDFKQEDIVEEDEGDDGLNSDSDDDDPYCDEVLETKLRVIKAKASRHTFFPAYTAAVQTYTDWLTSDSSSNVTQEQRSQMTSQLELYKQVVDLYGQWDVDGDTEKVDNSYRSITLKLVEAKKLGDPPQVVADCIASVLNDEGNVKIHKEMYSSMVDAMVTDLSTQIQKTNL